MDSTGREPLILRLVRTAGAQRSRFIEEQLTDSTKVVVAVTNVLTSTDIALLEWLIARSQADHRGACQRL